MLDLTVLPDELIQALKKRGHSEIEIQKMEPDRAFSEFCNWHGLSGWGDSLWFMVQELKDAET